jgi:hypothetical protein
LWLTHVPLARAPITRPDLKLNHADMSRARVCADVAILGVALVFAATGTAWAFLPGSQEA